MPSKEVLEAFYLMEELNKRREEIREGVAKMLYVYKCQGLVEPDRYVDWSKLTGVAKAFYRQDAGHFLINLKQKGCVLKVDREVPKPRYPNTELDAYCWEAQTDMVEAGYVAVEPLIETP